LFNRVAKHLHKNALGKLVKLGNGGFPFAPNFVGFVEYVGNALLFGKGGGVGFQGNRA